MTIHIIRDFLILGLVFIDREAVWATKNCKCASEGFWLFTVLVFNVFTVIGTQTGII